MIPKIIHHIWITGPFKYRDFRLSWMWHNPTYDFRFTTFDNLELTMDMDAIKILSNSKVFFLLKVELLKWYILYKYGGIYADTDMECLKPFNELLRVSSFAGIESPDGNIGNAIMGAMPGNKNVYNIYRFIVNTINSDLKLCNKRPVRMCGERAAFIQACLHQFEVIHPRGMFYPFDIVELDKRNDTFPDAYTKHHWTGKSEDGWIERAKKFLQNKKEMI